MAYFMAYLMAYFMAYYMAYLTAYLMACFISVLGIKMRPVNGNASPYFVHSKSYAGYTGPSNCYIFTGGCEY